MGIFFIMSLCPCLNRTSGLAWCRCSCRKDPESCFMYSSGSWCFDSCASIEPNIQMPVMPPNAAIVRNLTAAWSFPLSTGLSLMKRCDLPIGLLPPTARGGAQNGSEPRWRRGLAFSAAVVLALWFSIPSREQASPRRTSSRSPIFFFKQPVRH